MTDKPLISAPRPGSFVHAAHIGYDAEKGFTPSGVDPSWLAVLGDLQKHDIDEVDIVLIKQFMREDRKDKFEAATNGGST